MNLDVDIAIKYHIAPMINKKDEYYMNIALKQANVAYNKDEVPVGAVIVMDGKIISKAHNLRQSKHDVMGHAEILAIKKATKKLNAWILDNATLYVTLEPCLMCSGAILQSRIKRIVFATFEPKHGVMGSIMNITSDKYKFNHKIEVVSGVLKDESSNLLKKYFKEKRGKTRKLTNNKN